MTRFVEQVIDLFETVHPLDRVPRAGYVLRGVPEPESVVGAQPFCWAVDAVDGGWVSGAFRWGEGVGDGVGA